MPSENNKNLPYLQISLKPDQVDKPQRKSQVQSEKVATRTRRLRSSKEDRASMREERLAIKYKLDREKELEDKRRIVDTGAEDYFISFDRNTNSPILVVSHNDIQDEPALPEPDEQPNANEADGSIQQHLEHSEEVLKNGQHAATAVRGNHAGQYMPGPANPAHANGDYFNAQHGNEDLDTAQTVRFQGGPASKNAAMPQAFANPFVAGRNPMQQAQGMPADRLPQHGGNPQIQSHGAMPRQGQMQEQMPAFVREKAQQHQQPQAGQHPMQGQHMQASQQQQNGQRPQDVSQLGFRQQPQQGQPTQQRAQMHPSQLASQAGNYSQPQRPQHGAQPQHGALQMQGQFNQQPNGVSGMTAQQGQQPSLQAAMQPRVGTMPNNGMTGGMTPQNEAAMQPMPQNSQVPNLPQEAMLALAKSGARMQPGLMQGSGSFQKQQPIGMGKGIQQSPSNTIEMSPVLADRTARASGPGATKVSPKIVNGKLQLNPNAVNVPSQSVQANGIQTQQNAGRVTPFANPGMQPNQTGAHPGALDGPAGNPRKPSGSADSAQSVSANTGAKGNPMQIGAMQPKKAKERPGKKPGIKANGAPLLDEKAMQQSSIFDGPPTSIKDGMKDVDSSHKKRKKLFLIIGIAAVVVAALIAIIIAFTVGSGSDSGSTGATSQSTSTSSSTSTPSSSSAGQSSKSSSSSADSSNGAANQAGSVVYQYTALTADGIAYNVEETVTFKSNGDCEYTEMDMTFPDAATAKSFTDSLAKDYGSTFTLDSLDGANAVVTIDNSGLHLNREEYESALRYSVEDLVILKK